MGSYSSSGPSSHGIVMVFMDLYVCTKLKFTVLVEMDVGTNDHRTWAEGVRDAIACRETVESKGAEVNHFDHEAVRHALE